jgi:hypothetical protein
MVGLSLVEAEEQLALWLAASRAVSQSQAYTIATDSSSRSLTRTDAKEIREQIVFWQKQVNRCLRGGLQISRITLPHDN